MVTSLGLSNVVFLFSLFFFTGLVAASVVVPGEIRFPPVVSSSLSSHLLFLVSLNLEYQGVFVNSTGAPVAHRLTNSGGVTYVAGVDSAGIFCAKMDESWTLQILQSWPSGESQVLQLNAIGEQHLLVVAKLGEEEVKFGEVEAGGGSFVVLRLKADCSVASVTVFSIEWTGAGPALSAGVNSTNIIVLGNMDDTSELSIDETPVDVPMTSFFATTPFPTGGTSAVTVIPDPQKISKGLFYFSLWGEMRLKTSDLAGQKPGTHACPIHVKTWEPAPPATRSSTFANALMALGEKIAVSPSPPPRPFTLGLRRLLSFHQRCAQKNVMMEHVSSIQFLRLQCASVTQASLGILAVKAFALSLSAEWSHCSKIGFEDPCSDILCGSGNCSVSWNNDQPIAQCACFPGFNSTAKCETCDETYCHNEGICNITTPSTVECICLETHSGRQCGIQFFFFFFRTCKSPMCYLHRCV